MSDALASAQTAADRTAGGAVPALLRFLLIALIAFLTVVDLFATQAILPSLTQRYGVSPAAMGFAVNSTTLGMATASLLTALFSQHLNRRLGIFVSLFLLAIPTALLAVAPDLTSFTILRMTQGLFMASAFTLTLAYLGEQYTPGQSASVFAAYITGNVASNLIGRLASATAADVLGVSESFYLFAGLNLAGAILVFFTIKRYEVMGMRGSTKVFSISALTLHLGNPALRATFLIGFLILFAFIGTFTYVNFVLAGPPFSLSAAHLGLVYFVFAPAIATTPLAGRLVDRFGRRRTLRRAFAVAVAGLPLLLVSHLAAVLIGLALIAIGTFCAQAIATGFVGRAASTERGAASGLYLASYFLGGLVGSAVLGTVFAQFGWPATVVVIGFALTGALILVGRLHRPDVPDVRSS